jgi:hypothetical protein
LHQLGSAETEAALAAPQHTKRVPWLFLGWNQLAECAFSSGGSTGSVRSAALREGAMSLGLILIILVLIYLLGGFSGRFGGYGYGMGHSGMGIGGVVLVVLVVLLLLGKL